MGGFSAGGAIGAGFRLIGREPLAFLVWCLVMLLLLVLPMGWVFSQFFQMIEGFARIAAQNPNPRTPPPEMFQLEAQMLRLQPVYFLSLIVSQAVVAAAVFRAGLRPEERSWAFLRLGARELWLALVVLVIGVFMFLGMFPMMIAMLIAAVIARAMDPAAASIMRLVVMLAAMGVGVWALLRISLAPVMSFANRNFVLFESWRLTRGHALKMFGVAVALAAILWIVELVLFAGAFSAAATIVPLDHLFDTHPGANPLKSFARLGVGFWSGVALAVSALYAFSSVIFGAAWASIYRDLQPAAPAEPSAAP